MSVLTWKIECTDGKKDAIPLSVGKTVIGRGHLLQIRELKVSRHHAEVQITEEGEFVLKAMHPGLPCFYKREQEETRSELLRGATVTLHDGDIFSLHANPDCEFKVIQGTDEDTPKLDAGGDNKKEVEPEKSPPVKEDNEKEEDNDDDDEEEEEQEEEKEEKDSDWGDKEKRTATKRKPPTKHAESEEEEEEEEEDSDYIAKKSKSRTGRTKKKPQTKRTTPSRNSRRPAPKRRKAESSGEELSEENSEGSDSDFGGRRSRRQPTRVPQRLPARRATKPVSYNEDLMLGGMSPSESEQESEGGLPRIGRQKKPDSDSDFKVDEDSGSDWEEGSRSKKGSRRSAPPPKVSSRKGRRTKNFDSSDEEPEYVPRASKRRGTVERTKCKFGEECYRKNKDHKTEHIHPGDSDWSDSSQEEEKDDKSEKGTEEGSE